jgi:hypothetical protein
VLVKPKTLEAREFARPAIGADDALLRIEACGICGSDYEQYEGAQPQHEDYNALSGHSGPRAARRHRGDRRQRPRAMGRGRRRSRGRALGLRLRPL